MYRVRGAVSTPDRGTWETAIHGTWWYAVRSILDTMVLIELDNMSLGHAHWGPGAYCLSSVETARTNAVPHALFGDSVYHRPVIELLVNTDERRRRRARGGEKCVSPWNAAHFQKFWVQSNARLATEATGCTGGSHSWRRCPWRQRYPFADFCTT